MSYIFLRSQCIFRLSHSTERSWRLSSHSMMAPMGILGELVGNWLCVRVLLVIKQNDWLQWFPLYYVKKSATRTETQLYGHDLDHQNGITVKRAEEIFPDSSGAALACQSGRQRYVNSEVQSRSIPFPRPVAATGELPRGCKHPMNGTRHKRGPIHFALQNYITHSKKSSQKCLKYFHTLSPLRNPRVYNVYK